MEDLFDDLWFAILDGFFWVAGALDSIFGLFHFLGPFGVVLCVAVLCVVIQKRLALWYRPKRHTDLRRRYVELRRLRDEAMKWSDTDNAKRLARNIDQGELNQAYYNYFFEGLMVNLLTRYIPFLVLMTYVNESYKAERLQEHFGRPYVLRFGGGGEGEGVIIGSVFLFLILVLLLHLGWFLFRRRFLARPGDGQDQDDKHYG